jgi:hypothetical protein
MSPTLLGDLQADLLDVAEAAADSELPEEAAQHVVLQMTKAR